MAKSVKNLSASIHRRLLNHAKNVDQEFRRILVSYGLERILYRLSISDYRDRYMLKGGMLVSLWTMSIGRFTFDIDLLKFGDLTEFTESVVLREFTEILGIDAEDGLKFDTSNVESNTIMEDQKYTGLQIRTTGFLGTATIPISIDLAYGEGSLKKGYEVDYGSLLDLPTAKIRAYSPESIMAEKFQAIVNLGLINSRIKDFYDLYTLPRSLSIDNDALRNSVKATFAQRETAIPPDRPVGLSMQFATNPSKIAQWLKYNKRTQLAGTNLDFVADEIWKHFSPICASILSEE